MPTPTVDPITVSVIQHRLRAIVEEMGEAMLRGVSIRRRRGWQRSEPPHREPK